MSLPPARFHLSTPDQHGNSPRQTVLAIAGEIDTTNAADFAEAVTTATDKQPTVLDLTPLTYLDSAGFATLTDLIGQLDIAIVLPPTHPLYKAATLLSMLTYDDQPAAAQALNAPPT